MRIVLPPFDKCNGHIVDVGQITTHPFSLILPMSSTEVGTTPLVPSRPSVVPLVVSTLLTPLSEVYYRATYILPAIWASKR